MQTFCGFDFGTSNTTIGTYHNHTCQLIPLENSKLSMRSAIFCDNENKKWVFGQEGINLYLDNMPGRLMMALKSVLGSSLMQDETLIFNEFVSYTQVLGKFVQYIKSYAEQFSGHELTQVVLGRPVHFHDTDAAQDRLAQNTLETIAKNSGFKEVTFQFEPIAAALAYETTVTSEQLALIIDMGGGTSDFTVIRLRPGVAALDRSTDVLANAGIHIAGTDFDHSLSLKTIMPLLGMGSMMRGSSSDIEVPSAYYHDLTTWHTLTALYNTKTIAHVRSIQTLAYEKKLLDRLIRVLQLRAGHHILNEVETCKQELSDLHQSTINLDFIEDHLLLSVTRDFFNHAIQTDVDNIVKTVLETIQLANIKPDQINAIFYTGGSTKIPLIHQKINPLFVNADVVHGDAFGSVGMGLTIEARRRYGS